MKPNQTKNRKFNLSKQTIQPLDNSKMAAIKAGYAALEAEHTTTIVLSVTVVEATTVLCVGICAATI